MKSIPKTAKGLPPLDINKLDEQARKAICAAHRSAEKLRDTKKRLGQKLVIYQDEQVICVDP